MARLDEGKRCYRDIKQEDGEMNKKADERIFIRCRLFVLKIYRFILEYILIAEWLDWKEKGTTMNILCSCGCEEKVKTGIW